MASAIRRSSLPLAVRLQPFYHVRQRLKIKGVERSGTSPNAFDFERECGRLRAAACTGRSKVFSCASLPPDMGVLGRFLLCCVLVWQNGQCFFDANILQESEARLIGIIRLCRYDTIFSL